MKTLRLHITITPTFDRKFVVMGHICRNNRVAALLTVTRAAVEGGEVLPVYTNFTPAEFYQIVAAVYPGTWQQGNLIAGELPGSRWQVRIQKLSEVLNPQPETTKE